MNPCSIKDVRAALSEIELTPQRRFGQNFLVDGNILRIILDAAQISSSDRILEVGPGLGVLTGPLSEKCEHLTCVEKDFKLTDYLRERFDGCEKVEVVGSDIMRVNFAEMDVNKCVSNLPYSCGTRFLVDFVTACKADLIVVMVQQEVAQKICGTPGAREYSLLGLLMQMDYTASIVKTVKPGCFWPRPDIDSSVVMLRKKKEPMLSEVEKIFLRKFAKAAFGQRRKKIGVLLRKRAGHDKDAAGIVSCFESSRPEQLSMDEWCVIAKTLCGR